MRVPGRIGRTPRIGRLLLGAALGLTPGRLPLEAQAPAAEPGKRLFETVCVACHTIGAGVRIGPDLQGVTARRAQAWLMRFIANPEQLRQEGDSVAAANLARFGVPMPNFGLTEPQVEAVIAYLGGAESAPSVRPRLFLPTLVLAVMAALGLTLAGLSAGTKRVEIRP